MQQQRSCFYANVENSKGEREGPLSRAGTRATRLPGRVALTGVEGLRGTSDVFRAKSTQSVSSSLKDSHPPLGLGSGPRASRVPPTSQGAGHPLQDLTTALTSPAT